MKNSKLWMEMMESKQTLFIPEDEYTVEFARSSGRGGQNVNKVETKVRIRWPYRQSNVLDEEQKRLIEHRLAGHTTDSEEVLVESQRHRTQKQNREDAVAKLHTLAAKALQPRKNRVRTGPTRAARERRLTEKRKRSEKKVLRKPSRE